MLENNENFFLCFFFSFQILCTFQDFQSIFQKVRYFFSTSMREKRKYIVVLAIYRMKSYGLACNFFFIEYLGLFIFFFKTIKIVLTFIGLSIRVLFSFVSLNLKMTQLISGYTSLFLFLVFYEFRRMIRFFHLLIFYLFKGFFF